MTHALARPDASAPLRARRGSSSFAALAFASLGLMLGASQPARAEPITLGDDASVATLAERVSAFANASRVRWIVAAKTRAEAQATIAKLGGRLPPVDRPLLGRVEAKTLAEAAPQYAEAGLPLAWIVVADDGQGADPHACSWQVS